MLLLRYCIIIYITCTYAFSDADQAWLDFEPMFKLKIQGSLPKKTKNSDIKTKHRPNFDTIWQAAALYAGNFDPAYLNKETGCIRCNKAPVPCATMVIIIDVNNCSITVQISNQINNDATSDQHIPYEQLEKEIANTINENANKNNQNQDSQKN